MAKKAARFIVWRKRADELSCLESLPHAIKTAAEAIEIDTYEEVVVVEVVKVVRSQPRPVVVKDF